MSLLHTVVSFFKDSIKCRPLHPLLQYTLYIISFVNNKMNTYDQLDEDGEAEEECLVGGG
jgi:hypothetical protein